MKSRSDIGPSLDPYGSRKQIVQRLDEIRTGNRGRGVEIGNLMHGMDAGVRSP
jgi:hypothetical protein